MAQCYPSAVSDQAVPQPASFGRRLLAVTMDWFMCLAIAAFISPRSAGGAQFTPLGVFFLEVVILTTLQGASAGQRILRLRIVDSNTGGRVTPGRLILRTALICLVFPALLNKQGRGYHDWVTHCRVVRY